MGGWSTAALHRNRPLCQKPFWLASHHITLCDIHQTLKKIFQAAKLLFYNVFLQAIKREIFPMLLKEEGEEREMGVKYREERR